MNQHTYIQQFCDLNFAPYKHLVENILVTDQLQSTRVPICPIDINKDTLKKIYNYLGTIDHKFIPNPHHSRLTHNWADPLRSHNWEQLVIKHKTTSYKLRVPTENNTFEISNEILGDVYLEQLVDKLLSPLDVKFYTIKVTKLGPYGWVAPHIDATAKDIGLGYAWIPLHEFPNCLKIFPWGWLQHQFGKMYLFNHSRYVHAVNNSVDKSRFVILCSFDLETVSPTILEQYSQSKTSFRNLFVD